jgi:hypothetical protein
VAAAWTIIGRRIRMTQAAGIKDRLSRELGELVDFGDAKLPSFPAPSPRRFPDEREAAAPRDGRRLPPRARSGAGHAGEHRRAEWMRCPIACCPHACRINARAACAPGERDETGAMADLVRFRTRDGRFLSGGGFFDVLRVRQGPPGPLETFTLGAATSQPPITDGGVLEVVAPGGTGSLAFLWTMVSHVDVVVGSGTVGSSFGGPGVNSEVFIANYGKGSPGLFLDVFGARVNGTEVSFQVAGRTSTWYFRVDPDDIVRAVGTTPFLDDTAFIFELGPFCAAVRGTVLDATKQTPVAGATVVADGGFSATTGADGKFQLADPSGNSCVPEGPLRLTVTEPSHRTAEQIITVPSKGAIDTTILIACRRITGRVVDDAGLGPNPSSVTLFGPAAGDPPQVFTPDPATGGFLFRCVRQGHYTLTYPGADNVELDVADPDPAQQILTVKHTTITGHISNAATKEMLAGASVRILATDAPAPVVSQGDPDRGRYTITGARSGAGKLLAELAGFVPGQADVAVPTNGSVTKDIELVPVVVPSGQSAVFNTGVADNGSVLPVGTADPHWRVLDAAGTALGPAVVVNDQHPFGRYFTTNDSMWVWSNAAGSGPVDQGIRFRLQFVLAAVSANTRITGDWGCDNLGFIRLNGLAPDGLDVLDLPQFTELNFDQKSHFTIVDPFQVGVNTLDFVITDRGNPGGLNVSNLRLTL